MHVRIGVFSVCIQWPLCDGPGLTQTPATAAHSIDCGSAHATGVPLEPSSAANQQALQYLALAFLHTVLAACTTLAPGWSLPHLFGFKATTATSLQLVNAGAYLWLFASCLVCLKVRNDQSLASIATPVSQSSQLAHILGSCLPVWLVGVCLSGMFVSCVSDPLLY